MRNWQYRPEVQRLNGIIMQLWLVIILLLILVVRS